MAPRFQAFVDVARLELGATALLSEQDSKHASKVLRLTVGDTITVVDNSTGRSFTSRIEKSNPTTEVRLIEELTEKRSNSRRSGILFALCKGERNDFVVEKATELGVSEIMIFQAERSIAQIKNEDYEKKLNRWQRIAESAAKQSGRNSIPLVTIFDSLSSSVKHLSLPKYSSDTRILCSLSKDSIHPSKLSEPKHGIWLAIGPEGDFTAQEESYLREHGFIPVTLGPHTLRSETAAIVAMSLAYGLWPEK